MDGASSSVGNRFDLRDPLPHFISLHLLRKDDETFNPCADIFMAGGSAGQFCIFTRSRDLKFEEAKVRVGVPLLKMYVHLINKSISSAGSVEMDEDHKNSFLDVFNKPVIYGKVVYPYLPTAELMFEKMSKCPFFDVEHINFFDPEDLVDMYKEAEVLFVQNPCKSFLEYGREIVRQRVNDEDVMGKIHFMSMVAANPKFKALFGEGGGEEDGDA